MTANPEPATASAYYGEAFPRVTATFLRDEQVAVTFAQTTLLIDHPASIGGTDLGPSPGDLLIAAVAACTAIYVARHCRRLGIPLESIQVGAARSLAGEAAPDGPLAGTGEQLGLSNGDVRFIPRITKVAEVRGPLTEEHLETIRYIASHCAIGETVKRGVELIEEVVHVTDPEARPFGGRSPRGDDSPASSAEEDCCGSGACTVP